MKNKYLKGFALGMFALSISIMSFNTYGQIATSAAPDMGNDSGNGGGGVKRNGRYMTFYSAGFYTEPVESVADEVPQLAQLIHFFNTTPYLSELSQVKYARELIPSSTRKYYKVHPNSFTPEVRSELIAEYERVMNVDTSEVALFAITDTNSRITYLLPEFFSLTAVEQQAILFHEAYWLVNPNATYQEVISAEMAFQAFCEQPESTERRLHWLELTGNLGDLLIGSIQHDIATGSLKGLESGGRIKLLDLLGINFFNCKDRNIGEECMAFIGTHMHQLRQQYPSSLFVRFVENKLAIGSVYIDKSCNLDRDRYARAIRPGKCNPQHDLLRRVDERDRDNGVWRAVAEAFVDLNSVNYLGKPQLSVVFDNPYIVNALDAGSIIGPAAEWANLSKRLSGNKRTFLQLYLILGRN